MERSKKKVHLWKRAAVHFALCFVMGFFTGFAPSRKTSPNKVSESLASIATLNEKAAPNNRSSAVESPVPALAGPAEHELEHVPQNQETETETETEEPRLTPRRMIIIVTPISTKDQYKSVLLGRLANTIKLVPQPLLWIVVEKQSNSDEVSKLVRKTGIMYRHLVFKENFTNTEAELEHQRNVALRHIEHHKLSGILHFAALSNVYDLGFFDELREIEAFGTWPMAILEANKNKVKIEGPLCDSSQVIGWHLNNMKTQTQDATPPPPVHVSSFGFNSSILWDPERWGRSSSVDHSSQNSIKFVKQVALEDETKLKWIPSEDCSKIMLWRLDFPFVK